MLRRCVRFSTWNLLAKELAVTILLGSVTGRGVIRKVDRDKDSTGVAKTSDYVGSGVTYNMHSLQNATS
jgi:hypothetical protein